MKSDFNKAARRRRLVLLLLIFFSLAAVYWWAEAGSVKNAGADAEALQDALAAIPAGPNVLSQAKQEHIWDIEHAAFALETYFGSAFKEAIRTRDAEALESFFKDEAAIALLPQSGGRTHRVGPVVESRIDSDTCKVASSRAAGVAKSLVQSTAPMEEIKRTRLRVLNLDTSDGRTWDSRILLVCAGLTSSRQWRVVESTHRLELTFSSDEEIKAGKIIAAWRDESRRSRHSKQPLMKEVTQATGLARLPLLDNWKLDPRHTSQYWFQIAVADFNKDDYPDIAVAPFYGMPLLLRSQRCERFDQVAKEMGIRPWKVQPDRLLGLAAWIDFDNDSWPDLLLGDRIYRNIEGRAFEDVTARSGLRFGHHAMGAVVADYDCDGLCDLYIVYQHDPARPAPPGPAPWVGDVQSGVENQLWRNEGGGRFRNVTAESNAGGGARKSFAAVWHFLNKDRYPDLYIANDFGQNVHLLNRGDGTFEDVSNKTKTADFATSMGVCAGDLDNDAQTELYVANMYSKMGRRIIRHVSDDDYSPGIYRQIRGSCAGNRLYTTTSGSNEFREVSEAAGVNQVGWAYAPTMADFNSDGLLDIYATTGFMSFNRGKPDG